ncbi:MAG: DUF4364 family protein [Clostridia bacterium]|nr:DUF4364 family protein [Clostridia bacterium]
MLPNAPAMLTESEGKLFTLLTLRELGSCSHLQLLDFMTEYGIMSYFDLALALPALVNEGQAARISHPFDNLYTITEAGLETLSFFVDRLPHSKVKLICDMAPDRRARFQQEKQYVGKLLQNDNGEYVAHLTLNDGSKTLLTLDIPSPEKSLAKSLVSSWPRCAGEIYQDLMRAFSEAQEDK